MKPGGGLLVGLPVGGGWGEVVVVMVSLVAGGERVWFAVSVTVRLGGEIDLGIVVFFSRGDSPPTCAGGREDSSSWRGGVSSGVFRSDSKGSSLEI